MSSYDFGFIGLAVMGQNLVLNIESEASLLQCLIERLQ